MRIRICISCGEQFEYASGPNGGRPPRFCPECKAKPASERDRFCPGCGEPLTIKQSFCGPCSLAHRCRRCSMPIFVDKATYCSWDCQKEDQPPRPTCRRRECTKLVKMPEVPRYWPLYCSDRCREMVARANHPERQVWSTQVVSWWNKWKIERWANPYNPDTRLHTWQLPHTPRGKSPTPWFTESCNTGLDAEDLHEDAIEAIRDWTHVAAFCFNEDLNTVLERPDERTIAYLFTQYMYETWAWKIMPWIWDDLPNSARFSIRQYWRDFTQAGGTMSDLERAELRSELAQLEKLRLPKEPKDKDQQRQRDRMHVISLKLNYPQAFAGLSSIANVKEIIGGNQEEARIEWNSRCDTVLLNAQAAAAPPRPRAAQARKVSKSSKAAQPRKR